MATTSLLGLSITLTPAALTALRIAPLVSSTASLTHAYMEWVTNSSFLGAAPLDSAISRLILGVDARPRDSKAATVEPGIELKKAKDVVIPYWFTKFFNTGVVSVVGLNSLTLLSASLNLLLPSSHAGWEASKKYYVVGLASAAAHYVFVPLVGRSVKALMVMAAEQARGSAKGDVDGKEEIGEGKAAEWVREWVGWHRIRMVTVDLVAWNCFAWGVIGAVRLTV